MRLALSAGCCHHRTARREVLRHGLTARGDTGGHRRHPQRLLPLVRGRLADGVGGGLSAGDHLHAGRRVRRERARCRLAVGGGPPPPDRLGYPVTSSEDRGTDGIARALREQVRAPRHHCRRSGTCAANYARRFSARQSTAGIPFVAFAFTMPQIRRSGRTRSDSATPPAGSRNILVPPEQIRTFPASHFPGQCAAGEGSFDPVM